MKLLTALTGYTYDTYPFLILEINNVIYLFNMPSCCCRIFFDSSCSKSRIRHIFLSNRSLPNSGGLLGALIALLKPWENKVEITCPKSVEDLYTKNQFFSKLPQKYSPHFSSEVYMDELVKVTPVMTGRSMSYSIECQGTPGKFLPEKAKKLGIKPGPNFSKLKAGETLYNEKGEAVTLADCIGDPIKGESLFIVAIPTESDIEAIPPIEQLRKYDIIVHLTPMHIVNSKKYLCRFPVGENVKNVCFGFSGRISYKTVSDLYQKFVDHSEGLLNPISTKEESNEIPESFISLSTGDSYIFSPSQKVSIVRDELFLKIQKYANYSCPLPTFESFAVTFLGTGAANPNRCRGDPGILIHTKNGFVALDMGEGYVGQLFRKYGEENAIYILKNLKFIFLTHNHCDHSFGLHSMLRTRSLFTSEKVQLFCDEDIFTEVKFFESLYEKPFNIIHVNSSDPKNKEFFVENMNNSVKVKAIDVTHTFNSKGCLLTIDNKWKVAYSGDREALGNDHFVEEIGAVDFLIHEGTFSSEHDTHMDDYVHSTINHAIEVQKKSSAKFMAVVHLSHKYDKKFVPCTANNAFIAFDYLAFSFDQIEEICHMVNKVNYECLEHIT